MLIFRERRPTEKRGEGQRKRTALQRGPRAQAGPPGAARESEIRTLEETGVCAGDRVRRRVTEWYVNVLGEARAPEGLSGDGLGNVCHSRGQFLWCLTDFHLTVSVSSPLPVKMPFLAAAPSLLPFDLKPSCPEENQYTLLSLACAVQHPLDRRGGHCWQQHR
mmetsp:Transcript_48567/g.95828  ORF Transcript_48567/g.95828 Transcript_48567/m.95828 type:complete len:163 (+) Transcript_48567:510-998(+)